MRLTDEQLDQESELDRLAALQQQVDALIAPERFPEHDPRELATCLYSAAVNQLWACLPPIQVLRMLSGVASRIMALGAAAAAAAECDCSTCEDRGACPSAKTQN